MPSKRTGRSSSFHPIPPRYGNAKSSDLLAPLHTAARKVEKALDEIAAGSEKGSDQKYVLSLSNAINRIEERANKPEIRGDDALREQAWAIVDALRARKRDAVEAGYHALISIRNQQIVDLRNQEGTRIENMTSRERENHFYQRELAMDRARRGR